MRTLISFLLLFSTTAFAEVSRDEATKIIDEMVTSNMISAEEGNKAKARLQTMSATEWSDLNKEAEEKAAEQTREPASVSVADPSTSDLSHEQLAAIESDLKVIAPHTVVPQTKVEQVVVPQTHVEHVVVPSVEVEHTVVSEVYVPQT